MSGIPYMTPWKPSPSSADKPDGIYTGHALSLKQPWATLLAHSKKTIEVRRWSTTRRGRILIHAARIPDERPEAWAHIPKELEDSARQSGGIVGVGELTGCVAYKDLKAFAGDQPRHLNELSWFGGRLLYGFVFTNLASLPFHACPGWMRFFEVEATGMR